MQGTRLEKATQTTLTAERATAVFGQGNWARTGLLRLPTRLGGYRQVEGRNGQGRPVLIRQRRG